MTDPSGPTIVRRSVSVSAAPERAFEVFTAGMDRWWPRQGYSIGAAPLRAAVLEPGEGGRWYQRDDAGVECTWGRVLVWEPPRRLVLAWQISHEWSYDPDLVTEVEVTFTPEPGGGTRVDLEHRHLDRYGEHLAAMLAAYDSPDGWQGLLAGYAAMAEPVRLDKHTLVLLKLRPDAPTMSEDEDRALQDDHLAHKAELVAGGHILAVGPPVGDDPQLRGLSIWADDPDTARRLAEQDPAVQAGRLAVEVATWMVPAGMIRFERVRVPRAMADLD